MEHKLRILLAEKGLTLSDLARSLKIDKSSVTRWNQGNVPVARARAVNKATKIPLAKLRPDIWGGK